MDINTEYELLTKDIYETLLTEEGVTINVQHNVNIQGKAFKHQIDVYWEYKIAGITHKVAIECKNYNSNVSVAKVRDFFGVLTDIGNVNGIIVSKNGFQKGAKEFGHHYGINLKELRKPINKDWKGRIKSIQLNLNIITHKIKERKINLDEDWIKENIKIPKGEIFSCQIKGKGDQIWIVKENGERIKNFHQLDNEIPQNWKNEENLTYKYEFSDGFLESEKYGLIKLNSIDYTYDISEGTPEPIIIDGTESAKAILKDAISGEIKFFDKNGKIK